MLYTSDTVVNECPVLGFPESYSRSALASLPDTIFFCREYNGGCKFGGGNEAETARNLVNLTSKV